MLDDCNFHECVNVDDFEAGRTLALIPPDGDAVFETAFLPAPASSGIIHHIELILENPDPSHPLRIDSLTLYSTPPKDRP